MDINQRKEQFSHAYVRAVASVAGYTYYKPEVDDDSIDCGVAAKGGITLRRPRLEMQLKCTSSETLGGPEFNFPLKLKNYDDLRDDQVIVPRILIVVRVPEDESLWLEHSEDRLCLKYCGYWLSLRGMPASTNTSTVTITIPRTSQFTVSELQSIMARIDAGGAV